MRTLHANGVDLELLIELIFVGYGLDDVGIGILHASVSVHERVNHVLRHDGIFGQFLYDNVLYAAGRLPPNAHVSVGNLGFEGGLQLGNNGGEALHGAVEVIYHALLHTR